MSISGYFNIVKPCIELISWTEIPVIRRIDSKVCVYLHVISCGQFVERQLNSRTVKNNYIKFAFHIQIKKWNLNQ